MGAKVFISWSGDLSKALGEAVRDWIPKVLQTVKPYFTPDDIEKGSRWAKEIEQELVSSKLGIICLTRDNQNSPWILFEAGALSKNLQESKVCPILFNLDTTELKGPLASFQATRFNKDDIKKLLESINNSCEETKLDQKNLDETFEMWWPKLETAVTEIFEREKTATKPTKRDDRDILEEILELARSNAKLFQSEHKGVSPITIEELIINFSIFKESCLRNNSIEMADLMRIEMSINRLCKEADFDTVLFGRSSFRIFPPAPVTRREKKKAINEQSVGKVGSDSGFGSGSGSCDGEGT